MPDRSNYNPDIHNRHSIRLKGYDYSTAGIYYITICAQNRDCLFGNIVNGKMELNKAGEMVLNCYHSLEDIFKNIVMDEFVIMPNHIHCLIIVSGERADIESAPTKLTTIRSIIQTFKRHSTIEYIKMVNNNILPPFNKRVWQRNYYEHIVRNETELNNIREYIHDNPLNWDTDVENPDFIG